MRRWGRSEKGKALMVSLAIHLVLLVSLVVIVVPGQYQGEPSLVVQHRAEENTIKERKLSPHQMKQQARPPAPTRMLREVVSKVPSPVFSDPVQLDEIAMEFPGTSMGSARPGVGMQFGRQGFQTSNIGRLFVRARKLGVILDNSGSMSEYLEDLRKEIRRGFRGAIFTEIWGCRLEAISDQRMGMIPGLIYHDPAAVMKGVRDLVERDKVDAIYWFTDLRDGETKEALEELEQVLRLRHRASGERTVKFYVRSVAEKPSRELAQIVERSGGEVEVGPM